MTYISSETNVKILFKVLFSWSYNYGDQPGKIQPIYIISTRENIFKDLEKVKDEMRQPCTYYNSIEAICDASCIKEFKKADSI